MRIGMVLLASILLSGCAMFQGDDHDELDRRRADDMIRNAEIAYEEGEIKAAELLLIQAETIAPNDERLLYRRGTIAYRTGDRELAARYFERTVEVNPRNAKAHYNLATVRLMEAQEHFQFYTANADPRANLVPITKLVGAIDEFGVASKDAGRRLPRAQSPLSAEGADR